MTALETFLAVSSLIPGESRLMRKQILLTVPRTHFLPLRSLEKEGSVAESLKRISAGRRSEGSVLITAAV